LTYALGRSIEPAVDGDTITGLTATLAAGGYRISSLVTAIVNSPAFASR
ncbi:MAG: hypothetical protein QOI66_4189, partial [Myxococcales bacterium]|nr:hypothetical protein [Myxococcales bacterium]